MFHIKTRSINVDSEEELDTETNQLLNDKYSLIRYNKVSKVFKKKENGKLLIHIGLYALGWIIFLVSRYLDYLTQFNSFYNSGWYSPSITLLYFPSLHIYIIGILAIIGIFNILYFLISRNNGEEVTITLEKNSTDKSDWIDDFCPNCGEKTSKNMIVCNNCGFKLKK